MKQFLQSTTYIDWHCPEILVLAERLADSCQSEQAIVENCFEWVRDQIKHSADFQLDPVTCKASEVLSYRTGFCYAKSHLLAALIRANMIPAGLCYQRLRVDDDNSLYCLHGLNAVYLENYGWVRLDARGNNGQINARFNPPGEQLAFRARAEGEMDLTEIYPEPLASVVAVLEGNTSYRQVLENLPDWEA